MCSFNNNELRNAPMAKLFISCKLTLTLASQLGQNDGLGEG